MKALELPREITSTMRATGLPLQVIQAGAGGTGARIAPGIAKLLRPGDAYHIYDPDTVETKNLLRQHFIASDVGRNKAELVADRALVAARPGVTIQGHPEPVGEMSVPAPGYPLILIGAVDSWGGRAALHEIMHAYRPALYIDAGNEFRAGQVAMATNSWPITTECGGIQTHFNAHITCLSEVFGQLFAPPDPANAPEETPGCALRVDLQSLAANNMAAALVLNLFTTIVDEVPFSAVGYRFSLLGGAAPLHLRKMAAAPEEAGGITFYGGITSYRDITLSV